MNKQLFYMYGRRKGTRKAKSDEGENVNPSPYKETEPQTITILNIAIHLAPEEETVIRKSVQ